jgi:hypothetical protein
MARLLGGEREGVQVYRCRGRRELRKRGDIWLSCKKMPGIYWGWVLWAFFVCDRSGFGWKKTPE